MIIDARNAFTGKSTKVKTETPRDDVTRAEDYILDLDEAIYNLLGLPEEAIRKAIVIDSDNNIDGKTAIVRCIRRLLDLDNRLKAQEFTADFMEHGLMTL